MLFGGAQQNDGRSRWMHFGNQQPVVLNQAVEYGEIDIQFAIDMLAKKRKYRFDFLTITDLHDVNLPPHSLVSDAPSALSGAVAGARRSA